MHRATRLKLTELNPHLTCGLCSGYLVEASTLVECLHSFCRTCILRYVDQRHQKCPVCDVQIHKTKPLNNVRPDKTKQNLVYKLVPNLFKGEMKRRRDFYAKHPEEGKALIGPNANEMRGEVGDLPILSNDEHISLSLEYFLPVEDFDQPSTSSEDVSKRRFKDGRIPAEIIDRRYLRCPTAVGIIHIKKFIRYKFGLPTTYKIEVMHKDDEEEALYDHYTLMDVAYIFNWRRRKPLPLTYRVYEPNKKQRVESTKATATADTKAEAPPLTTEISKPKAPTEQFVKTNGLLKNGFMHSPPIAVNGSSKEIPLVNGQSKDIIANNRPLKENKMNMPTKEHVSNTPSPCKVVGNGAPKKMSKGTPKKFVGNGPSKVVNNGATKKLIANGLTKDHASNGLSTETGVASPTNGIAIKKEMISKPVTLTNGGMPTPADVAKT